MEKWEYKTEPAKFTMKKTLERLNELGQEGWEVACIYQMEAYFVLKRKVTQ